VRLENYVVERGTVFSILLKRKTFQANDKGDNSTEIKASDTRLNPTYMLYYTISQIFHPTLTTGILPMAALIYMNASIFFGKMKMEQSL
jgi:hypothetical protein